MEDLDVFLRGCGSLKVLLTCLICMSLYEWIAMLVWPPGRVRVRLTLPESEKCDEWPTGQMRVRLILTSGLLGERVKERRRIQAVLSEFATCRVTVVDLDMSKLDMSRANEF